MSSRCIAVIPKNSRETIQVHRGTFNGHDLVHVRIWAMATDGEPIPTRAGVAFKVMLLPQLIAALEAAWMEAAR